MPEITPDELAEFAANADGLEATAAAIRKLIAVADGTHGHPDGTDMAAASAEVSADAERLTAKWTNLHQHCRMNSAIWEIAPMLQERYNPEPCTVLDDFVEVDDEQ